MTEALANRLCEVCPEPGHCCKRFMLQDSYFNTRVWSVKNWKRDALSLLRRENLPYMPLERGEKQANGVNVWFTCPKLDVNGRCTIYETRPKVCRDFLAASDPLCVFHNIVRVSDIKGIKKLLGEDADIR